MGGDLREGADSRVAAMLLDDRQQAEKPAAAYSAWDSRYTRTRGSFCPAEATRQKGQEWS